MDPEWTDLMLNSNALGIEGTAKALASFIQQHF